MSDVDAALLAVVARLRASVERLSHAPDDTAANARSRAYGSGDPRRDMAFHQVGALEQICRNESAALECAIKWLSALAGEPPDVSSAAWPPMETAGGVL